MLIALSLWANGKKAELQSDIDSGKSVADIAREKNVPVGSMRSVLSGVGISHGRKASTRKGVIHDILVVVNRLCIELNVSAGEIAKHL